MILGFLICPTSHKATKGILLKSSIWPAMRSLAMSCEAFSEGWGEAWLRELDFTPPFITITVGDPMEKTVYNKKTQDLDDLEFFNLVAGAGFYPTLHCHYGRGPHNTNLHYKKNCTYLKVQFLIWLRELDSNQRPLGYEPNELPGCSIPRHIFF